MRRKLLEKMKRTMAWVLTATMIFGTVAFDSPVLAQEGTQEDADAKYVDSAVADADADGSDSSQVVVYDDSDDLDETISSDEEGSNQKESGSENEDTPASPKEEQDVEKDESSDANGEVPKTVQSEDTETTNTETDGEVPATVPNEEDETGDEEDLDVLSILSDPAIISNWTIQLLSVGYEEEEIDEQVDSLNAEEDSLQEQINAAIAAKLAYENGLNDGIMLLSDDDGLQTEINGEVNPEISITLTHDYSENIVIQDGVTVNLDLGGHTLNGIRPDGADGTLSTITVFGNLILTSEGSEGILQPASGVDDIRGVNVGSHGEFTLEDGAIIQNFDTDDNGAGVRVENSGAFTMNAGLIQKNTAADYGGGIFAYDGSSVKLLGGTISENKAPNGGGVTFYYATEANTFQNVTFSGNEATDGNGGALYVDRSADLSFKKVTVEKNAATGAGGGFYFAEASTLTLSDTDTIFTKNTAGGNGGAIAMAAVGNIFTMTAGVLEENTSGDMGGGAYIHYGSIVTLDDNAVIQKNHAYNYGGGIAVHSNSGNNMSTFTMQGNALVTGNELTKESDSRYGAGIFIGYYATVLLSGSAIVTDNHHATHGGGIFIWNYSKVTMEDNFTISSNSIYAVSSSYGAGLWAGSNVTLTMTDGEIYENYSENRNGFGGGLYKDSGTMTMSGGSIHNNTASYMGGGIYQGGTLYLCGDALICENKAYYDNNTGAHGGGVANGTTYVQEQAQILDNYAKNEGGGIYGYVCMEGGLISGNQAGIGGAIRSNNMQMTGGEITGNTATGSGGAIDLRGTVTNEFSGGKICNNTAASCGGAIRAYGDGDSYVVKITGNIEITGNTAGDNGGAVYCDLRYVLQMDGGTVTNNTAKNYGGGIYARSPARVKSNNTVVNNIEITGGTLWGNMAKVKGRDLYVYAGWHTDYYRPRFKLGAAANMANAQARSVWLSELEQEDVSSYDNNSAINDLETDASNHNAQYWAFTYKVDEDDVARVGDTTYNTVQEAFDALAESVKAPEGETLEETADDASEEAEEETARVVTMLGDSREDVVVPEDLGDVVLELNGHALKGQYGSVITVKAGTVLTIRDSSEEQTGEIREGSGTVSKYNTTTASYGGGLFLEENAGAVLESGSICYNRADYGAVYLCKDATFTMTGGSVSENTGMGVVVYQYLQSSETSNPSSYGATFIMKNGSIQNNSKRGVYSNGSTSKIMIEGGSIAENNLNSGDDGAGIRVERGYFTMSGGEVKDNYTSSSGAGIVLNNGSGATITGQAKITNNTARSNGGAIYASWSSTITIAEEVVISGNEASGVGGALYLYYGSTVKLTDQVKITGNTAQGNGGAIYVGNSIQNLTIEDDVLITGNQSVNGNGGAIYWGPSNQGDLSISGGQIYGNKALYRSNDIFLNAKSIASIRAAAEMGVEGINCWYEAASGEAKKESITLIKNGNNEVSWLLTASEGNEERTEVVRIEDKKYCSLQEAVDDSKNMEEENPVIYLMQDITDSANIDDEVRVTVDLNGYTLTARQGNVFCISGTGDLTLQNTQTEDDANKVADGGKVLAAADQKNSRAVNLSGGTFTMKGGTLSGFYSVDSNGGAIYRDLTNDAAIYLESGTIENCSALNGGALYSPSNNSYQTTVKVESGFTIQNCSATSCGGALYLGRGTTMTIDGALLKENTAGNNGGAVYIQNENHRLSWSFTVQGDAQFIGNQALTGSGGAIYGYTNFDQQENEFLISGGTFENNEAYNNGGAVYLEYANINNSSYSKFAKNKVEIYGVTMTGNKVGRNGGALYVIYAPSLKLGDMDTPSLYKGNYAGDSYGGIYTGLNVNYGQKADFYNLVIQNNQSGNSYGGGQFETNPGGIVKEITVYGNQAIGANGSYGGLVINSNVMVNNVEDKTPVQVRDVQVYDNEASLYAGFKMGIGNFELENVNVYKNRAISYGSGLMLLGNSSYPYTVTMNDCSIYENSTNGYGGGLIVNSNANNLTLKLSNTTIMKNHSGSGGAGIYFSHNSNALELGEGTEIRGNTATSWGGGVYLMMASMVVNGATIAENAAGRGGGIYCYTNNTSTRATELTINDASITGNTATYGGGIYIEGHWNSFSYGIVPMVRIKGGEIISNQATESGGGIYNNSYSNDILMTGGLIKGNTAKYGGGVYNASVNDTFKLERDEEAHTVGQIYDNSASLGQDVYGNYDANQRTSELQLIPASDMFAGDAEKTGIAWLVEDTGKNITTKIQGTQIRKYYLTLSYTTVQTVATILDEKGKAHLYNSVQEAVNDIENGYFSDVSPTEGDTNAMVADPTIIMVADSAEYVNIPASVKATLNLNHCTLSYNGTTVITCYGDLTITDDKITDANESLWEQLKEWLLKITGNEKVGTISGSAAKIGGGIHVASGGKVTMEGGQITGCRAGSAGNSSSYGGAAVAVESGTFVLTGDAAIRNNTASYGAAVLVYNASASFQMTGGLIEDNTGSYGVIYNRGGTIQIAAGTIQNNTVTGYGAAIYNESGKVNISGTDADNPVFITGNSATSRGGAIYVAGGRVTIENAELSSNKVTGTRTTTVTDAAGGAIYINAGTLTLGEGTNIIRNSAVRGGAVYQHTGTVNILGATISRNTAQMGGGIAQNPKPGNNTTYTRLITGAVYDNRSTMTSTGNDFYSAYEGTDKYDAETMKGNVPNLSLSAASSMGLSNYNVWKDDVYSGTDRTGMLLGEGQYITNVLSDAYNVQLTADYYNTDIFVNLSDNYYVNSLKLINSDNKTEGHMYDGVVDGTSAFTSDSATEITAKQMVDSGIEGWTQSRDEIYLLNGTTYYYIFDADGNKYEQDQLVAWTPGGDSGAYNSLVRSYDTIQYTLAMTIQQKADELTTGLPDETEQTGGSGEGGESGEADGSKDSGETDGSDSVTTGTVHYWVEVTLPVSSDEASFALDSKSLTMKAYSLATRTQDGKEVQVLKGYWEQSVTQSWDGSQNITVEVYGMKNGDTLKPTFRAWIEGNEENKTTNYDENEVTTVPQTDARIVTISAKSQYNVSILRNDQLAYTGYFNLTAKAVASEDDYKAYQEKLKNGDTTGDQIVYGTIVGYGLTVMNYNDGGTSDIRGTELPADHLSFDLNMKGKLYMDGTEVPGSSSVPYVWAYKENTSDSYGKELNGSLYEVNMNWNDEDDLSSTTNYAYNAAPYNTGGGNNGCYNGGSWSITGNQPTSDMTEEQTTLHVDVSGYTFNNSRSDYSPSQSANGESNIIWSSNKVKPFSAGYIQVLFTYDPNYDPKDVTGNSTAYLTVGMEAAVSNLQIQSISGLVPEGTTEGLEVLNQYFGMPDYDENDEYILAETLKDKATHEMRYADNYCYEDVGQYVSVGSGDGDNIGKVNFFDSTSSTGGSVGTVSGSQGNGSTPLSSQLYIGSKVSFTSMSYRTDDPADKVHYIPDALFNPQADNELRTEYNYLTALDILQRFDADAFTPVESTQKIVNKSFYPYSQISDWTGGAFALCSDETATASSSPLDTTKTRSGTITILYAAKPDGKNWTKIPRTDATKDENDKDDGGTADMEQYSEENLLYFESMEELKAYFGDENAVCVGILYQLRDICIRTGRCVIARAKMQVTKDFACTGQTYATTNEIRSYTVYRPYYKANYKSRSEFLYNFDWHGDSCINNVQNGVTAYGLALTPGTNFFRLPDSGSFTAVEGTGFAGRENEIKELYNICRTRTTFQYVESIEEEDGKDAYTPGTDTRSLKAYQTSGYIKSRYKYGSKVGSTHTGWIAGNSVLLYTLSSSITLVNTDTSKGSGNNLKKTYNVSAGERIANFKVTPVINISSQAKNNNLVVNGTQATEITIEITLPKKLSYQTGSIRFDYSESGYSEGQLTWDVKVVKNENGTSTITLKSYINDISKALPVIRYSCDIGDVNDSKNEVSNGDSLNTTARIYATYEETNNLAAEMHSDAFSISITKNDSNSVYKLVENSIHEIGDDFVYTLNYSNLNATADSIQMIDILPYNGDGRDTSFNGQYRVKSIQLEFTDEASLNNFKESGGALKYADGKTTSSNTSTQNTMLNTLKQNGTALETSKATLSVSGSLYSLTYELGDKLIQDAATNSGIAVYASFPNVQGNSSVRIYITLTPRGAVSDSSGVQQLLTAKSGQTQQGGDVYWNDFFYKSSSDPVTSSRVSMQTINRAISGMVFLDMDQDGQYSTGSNDQLLKNVDAHLYYADENGKLDTSKAVTDVIGNEVNSVATSDAGIYRFDNLKDGSYIVVFDDLDDNYSGEDSTHPLNFAQLSVTDQDVYQNVNLKYDASINRSIPHYDETDSDSGPADLTRAQTYTSITLPKDTYTAQYTATNWNCGLYYLNLDLEKQWVNTDSTTIPDGTKISFDVTAHMGTDSEYKESDFYTYTKQTGNANQYTVAQKSDTKLSQAGIAPTAVQNPTETSPVIWSQTNIPLKAEGSKGVITYSFAERATVGTDSLYGFIPSSVTDKIYEGRKVTGYTFSAHNTQIKYTLEALKQSENGVNLPGAQFTVYKDAELKNAVKSVSSDKNGSASITDLIAVTQTGTSYYIRETQSPRGYSINQSVYQLDIAYDDLNEPYTPTFTLTQIKDQNGATIENPVAMSEWSGSMEDYVKDNDLSTAQYVRTAEANLPLGDEAASTTKAAGNPIVTFRCIDECIYTLPQTGGHGIMWNTLLGTAMMLTALWLFQRKRNTNHGA